MQTVCYNQLEINYSKLKIPVWQLGKTSILLDKKGEENANITI